MNVLVTGANSQIGYAIENRLKQGPLSDDYILTSLHPKEGQEFLDITDEESVKKFITEKHINVVINTAAWTDVDGAEKEENREKVKKLNADAPGYLAEACKINGAKLIHISTDFVFNGQTFRPYEEDRYTLPSNYYGAMKLEGEQNIKKSGCKYLIFRIQGLYSKYKSNNFVNKIIEKLKNDEIVNVVQDRITSLTNADNFAWMLVGLVENNGNSQTLLRNGVYHYSDQGCASWYDIAITIAEALGITKNPWLKVHPISANELKTPANRGYYYVLDKSKYMRDFKCDPYLVPSWEEHLITYVKNYDK